VGNVGAQPVDVCGGGEREVADLWDPFSLLHKVMNDGSRQVHTHRETTEPYLRITYPCYTVAFLRQNFLGWTCTGGTMSRRERGPNQMSGKY